MIRRGAGMQLDLPHARDGRPILSRADLERYDASPRRAGGRERYFCPIHGGDHQRSLSVRVDDGVYHCFTCHASGQLRDYWPKQKDTVQPEPLSMEELGRRALERRVLADEAKQARLTAALPVTARRFLSRLADMTAALRDPTCPGAVYLRKRGLDPERAAALGAGYAAPATWPGDQGRRVGRIVYPLHAPTTGQVVSALGRLCLDADPAWPEPVQAQYRAVKQRKLPRCPAGVWPYASIVRACQERRPLVLVEGPADALALLQSDESLAVVALVGTANVLPRAVVRAVPGIVLALDDDESGRAAMQELRFDLAVAGVVTEMMPSGWLGGLAKDPAEFAAHDAGEPSSGAGQRQCDAAVAVVRLAAARLSPQPWDEQAMLDLIGSMYERCSAAYEACPVPRPPLQHEPLDFYEQAIDQACVAHDWAALTGAVAAYEQVVLDVVGATGS